MAWRACSSYLLVHQSQLVRLTRSANRRTAEFLRILLPHKFKLVDRYFRLDSRMTGASAKTNTMISSPASVLMS